MDADSETLTYGVVHLLGVRPPTLPEGQAMFAPRPLLGAQVSIPELDNWAGLVVVLPALAYLEHDARRRWEILRNNQRMDARLIVWTERAEALRQARDYLTADYDAAAVATLTDAELLSTWASFVAMPKQVTVTGWPDPTHPKHGLEDWTD